MSSPVSGVAAKPTLIAMGTLGSPQTFATIANIGDIDGPQFSADQVETTSHSTGDAWDTYISTIVRGGEFTFPLFFVPGYAGHSFTNPEGLGFVFANRQLRWYRMTGSNGNVLCYFQANISSYSLSAPVAGVYTAQTTFKLTGQPIFV